MIKALLSLYRPRYLEVLVYMLQSTEYEVKPYLKWFWRTQDFNKVMHRRELDRTRAAELLLTALRLGAIAEGVLGLWLICLGLWYDLPGGIAFGLAAILAYPIIWAHLLILPLLAGRWFINKPLEKRLVRNSQRQLSNHSAIKIAVAGSYGKTTMKELLATVLAEGKKVAATPANKNVSVSHAQFAKKLAGDEDILIIEYGEGKPGDIERFAKITKPTHAIITGLAPAHLDQYKTLEAAGRDIFFVADYVKPGHAYVNNDPNVRPFLKKSYCVFDSEGALGWKVKEVSVKLSGTLIKLSKAKRSIVLKSGIIGRHQVGYLAFVAALALELGLSEDQVVYGISKTHAFAHRMQPYRLSGAWIVDDTYNGNLEGIRAGTQLLKEVKAKRKIYVTPGLVDQGEETSSIHKEVGRLIAVANPNMVVLMNNSVTEYIVDGLKNGGYAGDLRIENNPLSFYNNLKHFVAYGDLVVMQNDWTDNYT